MSQQREHSTLGFACRVVLLLLLPVAAGAAELGLVRLDDVVVATQPGATTIQLKTSGPATYRAEYLDAPARLVVDLERTTFAWRGTPLAVSSAPLRAIRGSQYRKDVARVVVEFKERSGYVITEEPYGLTIVIPTAVATPRPGVA